MDDAVQCHQINVSSFDYTTSTAVKLAFIGNIFLFSYLITGVVENGHPNAVAFYVDLNVTQNVQIFRCGIAFERKTNAWNVSEQSWYRLRDLGIHAGINKSVCVSTS